MATNTQKKTCKQPLGRIRTNIDLDADLIEEVRGLSGLRTRKEIVDEALKAYLRVLKQRAGLELFGKLPWDGDLAEVRRGRRTRRAKTVRSG